MCIRDSGTTKYTVSELTELLGKEEKPIYVAVNEEDVCVGYAFCQLQEQPFSTNMVPFKSLFIDDLCVDQHARGPVCLLYTSTNRILLWKKDICFVLESIILRK